MVKRNISDQTLVYKIQTFHDREAYAMLYRAYVDDIYRFIAFKVPTTADAEELTADVFLKVWNHLTTPQKSTVRGFRAFIYQTARHTIIDWYRKKARTEEPLTDAHRHELSDTTEHAIETETDQTLQFEALMTAMEKLKSEYKEVLMLKYIDELSTAEIAAVLGKKQTAIRVTLHRATKTLQELMNLS